VIAVAVIHLTFSFWTRESLFQFLRDLPFGGSLRLKMLDRGLHGSDARVYDTEGRFRAEAFESIFSKYGETRPVEGAGAGGEEKTEEVITWAGIMKMLQRNRSIFDPTGWTATFLEWGGLYWVAGYDRGYMTKEDVRAMYDGTLWPKLAERVALRRGGWAIVGGDGSVRDRGGRMHAA
jgi:peroxygenase